MTVRRAGACVSCRNNNAVAATARHAGPMAVTFVALRSSKQLGEVAVAGGEGEVEVEVAGHFTFGIVQAAVQNELLLLAGIRYDFSK
jgi:hypothetical protein